MFTFRYGGKKGKLARLVESKDLIVVRTRSRGGLDRVPMSRQARRILDTFQSVVGFRHAGVEVLRTRTRIRARALRDRARRLLKGEPAIEFAGRALCDPETGAPVVYTENFFVKFADGLETRACERLLARHGLEVKRRLEYAKNSFFASAPRGTGLRIFQISRRLLEEKSVELCHPELIREARRRAAFPQQWHLKETVVNGRSIDAHANVEAAWKLSEGKGTIIALIDDGVDVDHEEFRSPKKIASPRDVTLRMNSARPGTGDNHGTACAGVACADGARAASGVAPKARLMPIRLSSGLGSQDEADAFLWAARKGAHVISCSWGPMDGDWWNPEDPLHGQKVPLPDSTRLAIDWAVEKGRRGKGCVIVFAAGNGNESVDNDGYASYEKVMAVAASNDSGKKAAYSDHGRAIWCSFPSSNGSPSKTPGIWTTDRTGRAGYNPGQARQGDIAGNYTNSFGGTSSAAPGAAGVAALVLARNPALRWTEVREIIRGSCDKIDRRGGKYDASGRSRYYGFGRVNAKKAVESASASTKSS